VRDGSVSAFADTDNDWPLAEEYAHDHDLPTASDVIRLALRRLLRPDDTQEDR